MSDDRLKDRDPSALSELLGELASMEPVSILGQPSIEEVRKRLRRLRPNAKGPRPTPILVSERKRKRRAARDARKLNRA